MLVKIVSILFVYTLAFESRDYSAVFIEIFVQEVSKIFVFELMRLKDLHLVETPSLL